MYFILFLFFSVPVCLQWLSPGSCALPVLRDGLDIPMELLWVSPVLSIAWSAVGYVINFWVIQCPSAAPVLSSSWCTGSIANPNMVTVSPVRVVISSPLAFSVATPSACFFIKIDTWACSVVFFWVNPPLTSWACRWMWAFQSPV